MLDEIYYDTLKYDFSIKNVKDRKTRRSKEKQELIKQIKGQAFAEDLENHHEEKKERPEEFKVVEKMKRLADEAFTC